MSIFVAPKVFVDATDITHDEFNALIAAATAATNNISDEQITPTADIDAAKLADGTIGTSQITDDVLATAKFGVDVAAVGASVEADTGTQLLTLAAEETVIEVQRSVLGGMVLALGAVSISHAHGGAAETNVYEAWLAKDGTQLGANRIPFKIGGWITGALGWITVPVIYIETVAEGLHTWTLNVKHVSGGGIGAAKAWQLLVWEWR